jgi:tRNA A37 threonylcarbamoyladenosine dehydratase
MYTEEAEDELLGGRPDFVLDAIDNIHTKVHGPALHPERMAPITPSFRTGNRSRPE